MTRSEHFQEMIRFPQTKADVIMWALVPLAILQILWQISRGFVGDILAFFVAPFLFLLMVSYGAKKLVCRWMT